jgi:hypothetical protein
MRPTANYELSTADLRCQTQRDALARDAAHVPSGTPQRGRNRILVSLRRAGRQRRLGRQLWVLLHAQALLDGPAAFPHQRHLHAQAACLSDRQ